MKHSLRFLTESAIIAAFYIVLTLLSAMLNLAYGPVQFRISEVLTILPVFTPAAIPGLTIGCFLSNLGSPLGPVDWIFGTSASLIAAILTRLFRNIKIKGIPVVSFFFPVIVNALIVGFEIAGLTATNSFNVFSLDLAVFSSVFISVFIGQFAVCYLLGIPFFMLIRKFDFMSHKKLGT